MYDFMSTKDIIDILHSFFQKNKYLSKYKLLYNKSSSHGQPNIPKFYFQEVIFWEKKFFSRTKRVLKSWKDDNESSMDPDI